MNQHFLEIYPSRYIHLTSILLKYTLRGIFYEPIFSWNIHVVIYSFKQHFLEIYLYRFILWTNILLSPPPLYLLFYLYYLWLLYCPIHIIYDYSIVLSILSMSTLFPIFFIHDFSIVIYILSMTNLFSDLSYLWQLLYYLWLLYCTIYIIYDYSIVLSILSMTTLLSRWRIWV